jgi:hypothetical protein
LLHNTELSHLLSGLVLGQAPIYLVVDVVFRLHVPAEIGAVDLDIVITFQPFDHHAAHRFTEFIHRVSRSYDLRAEASRSGWKRVPRS